MYSDMKIKEFIDILQKKTPTPGGGAVTSLVASLSAALGIMVTRYSLGKKGLEEYEELFNEILEKLIECKERLLDYADEDSKAYEKIKKALKSKDEKEKEEAFKEGTLIPFKIAKCAYSILEMSYDLLKFGNKNLKADAEITGLLAWAALQSGMLLAKENVSYVKDEEFRKSILEDVEFYIKETDELVKKIKELLGI